MQVSRLIVRLAPKNTKSTSHSPALNKRVAFPACDKMIRHDRAIHPWNRNLKRRTRVLKLFPADVFKPTNKDNTNIHPDAAIMYKARTAQEIGAVRASVGTVHCALDKGLRERIRSNPLQGVVRRARNIVKNADGPGRTTQADPVYDVALTPAGHGANAGMPVGPYVLF